MGQPARTQINVRIDQDVADRLYEYCIEEHRSKSYAVSALLRLAFDILDAQK